MKLQKRYHKEGFVPPVHWRDQKNLSTQEALSPARPRIPAPDEHERRRPRAAQPSAQGPGAPRVKRRLRLRRRSDFQSAISGRRFHSGRALVGFAVPAAGSENRVGVTVSRGIKTSVERNLARRRVREVAREGMLGPDSPLGRGGIRYDVVLIARPAALEVSFSDLRAE